MRWKFALLVGAVFFVAYAFAQPPFGRQMRQHKVIQSTGKLDLLPANESPSVDAQVSIEVEGPFRVVRANGIPMHATGQFPNRGNPNRIASRGYVYRLPAKPKQADTITSALGHPFGIAINGVPFDPGAAEFYLGDRAGGWQYEPLSGAIRLGIDASHAHVQPNGAYHYHGLPTGLLDEVKLEKTKHSPLIGWAADGFPIYAVYGYSNPKEAGSKVVALRSSYQLKKGNRPSDEGQPGGTYDGTFVADYHYVKNHGDLDPCNGRFTLTPDFPEGTYASFLSENWPVIPRYYQGTPSKDFERRGPGQGPRRAPGGR